MLSLAWGQMGFRVNRCRVALLALFWQSYAVTAERRIHLVCATTMLTSLIAYLTGCLVTHFCGATAAMAEPIVLVRVSHLAAL